jgi:hypothetical protein
MVNLFTEGFAGDIDTTDRRKSFLSPFRQSAIQDRNILVTEFPERMGCKRSSTFAFVVHDDGNPPVRHQFGDAKFDLAPRQRGRVSNLTSIELAPLTDVEYGVQSFRSHQSCQLATRNLVRHNLDPTSIS